MSLKITKLIVKDPINKKTKKPYNNPSFFELLLEFEIKDGPKEYDEYHFYFDRLGDYYQTTFLNDPKKYMKEISDYIKNNKKKDDWVGVFNRPTKEKLITGWAHGIDMITRKKDKYLFHEYFSYTPVTRGILTELKKMKKDPRYSVKTIPEQYLAHLLISLSNFWD